MAVGNSDFSGVAQGNIGQGFAQGMQSGIDNYNKGVDRKAAQANTYLTQFIGPNLQKLSTALPRPSADSSPAEFAAWVQAEEARQRQVALLLGQSEKYLKATGSPIGKEEWAGLFYNPTDALPPEQWAALTKSFKPYSAVDGQLRELRNKLIQTDPNSETYKVLLEKYNKIKTDSGFEQLYKDVHGIDYQETIGGPEEAAARRKDLAAKGDQAFLVGLQSSASKPEIRTLVTNLIERGVTLDTTDPASGKTYRQILMDSVDTDELEKLATSGPQGVNVALSKILAMSSEDKTKLTGAAKQLWNDYQTYKVDPDSVAGPNKQVFDNYTIIGQEVVKNAGVIKLQGIDYIIKDTSLTQMRNTIKLQEFELDSNHREAIWKFGAAALDGNQAVRASKDEFMGMLPENMSQEEKEAIWEKAVEQPLATFAKQQANNIRTVETNLLTMDINNSKAMTDSVENGTFHLTTMFKRNADGTLSIDKTSPIYERVKQVQGNPSDETIMAWAARSQQQLANQDKDTQNKLNLGASQVVIAKNQEKTTKVEADYAEKFAVQRLETGQLNNESTRLVIDEQKLRAKVAVAKQRGEMTLLLAEAVKANGVGILSDPTFKAVMSEAVGGEGAYNAAKAYLIRQQDYNTKVQNNQLTLQGQQISSNALDDFDRMFKTPEAIQMYINDPAKVEKLALAAGIDPNKAKQMLVQLKTQNRTLSDLQIKQIRFDMHDRQQRLDLAVKEFEQRKYEWTQEFGFKKFTDNRDFIESARRFGLTFDRSKYESDRAFNQDVYRWRMEFRQRQGESDRDYQLRVQAFVRSNYESDRNYNRGVFESDRNYGFEVDKFNDFKTFRDKEWAQSLIKDARDFAQRQLEHGDSVAASTREFQVMYMTPLREQINIIEGQVQSADAAYKEIISSDPNYTAFLTNKIKWQKNVDPTTGEVSYKAMPIDSSSRATFNALAQKGIISQLEEAYSMREGYRAELQNGKNIYSDIVEAGRASFGNGVYSIPDPVSKTQLAASPSTITKTNFKTYQQTSSTIQGASIAGYVQNVVNGKLSSKYANILTPGYCTTFVQGMMGELMNVPGGIPVGGDTGANGFMNGLLQKPGVRMYPGTGNGGTLSAKDIANLPDGTILIQKDDTVQGHAAMVLGGMVVQNSRYKDNKIAGAVGTMSLKDFVSAKGTSTYAITVPDSWYKNGAGPRNVGGGATGTTTSQVGAKPTTTKPTSTPQTPTKYTDGSGKFLPDLPKVGSLLGANMGKGVRMVASPGGNSGLTFKTGQNRYAVIQNGEVAMQAVDQVGAQFGTYFAQVTKTPLAAAYKQSPTKVINALVVELKKAGFSGDLQSYAKRWIAGKGWK